MKWIFWIFALIIGGFALAAFAGYHTTSEVKVQRTVDLFAMPEDIFPYLANLESQTIWSPWHDGESHKGFVVNQTEDSLGQTSVWICESKDCIPGSEEIKLVQYPEYVQSDLNLEGQVASATYGLMKDNADGSTTILIEITKDLGGFPYIQRLFNFREVSALEGRLDRALGQLTDLIEADGLLE